MDKDLTFVSKLSDSLTLLCCGFQALTEDFPEIKNSNAYNEIQAQVNELTLLLRNEQVYKDP